MANQTVEIHLGYYKKGDDMARCLEHTKSPQEAIKLHAESMRSVAEHLDKIAAMVNDNPISIHADTHYIGITCNKKLAQKLIEAELADKDMFDDEESGN